MDLYRRNYMTIGKRTLIEVKLFLDFSVVPMMNL